MSTESDIDKLRRWRLSPILGREDFRPSSAAVRVEFAAKSHPGRLQPRNEDHYLILRLGRDQETLASSLLQADLPSRFEEHAYTMVVADGVTGSGAGALGSRLAISTLAHLALHFGQWNMRIDERTAQEIAERAEWFYHAVDHEMECRSRVDPGLSGMATTLTATYSAGDDLFLAHVGQSRAYLFRNGDLQRLTRDRTRPRQSGAHASLVELPAQDLRHILTNTIGGHNTDPQVQIGRFRLLDGDSLLLCTNGLTDVLDDDHIAEILTHRRQLDEQCELLIEGALDRGTTDNVTALLAQYRVPTPSEI